ncbi:YcxB family protein [Exiguobacterium alkaliphilum]|uniref:YcxB family protein n=1 Tax=Exiguobacterium alkaliphilum TaxID=1428684 RepID=A0ABT2KW44_9BACL|nr:YcxB family protein [Exiguobacterium alkaliphilum]MCT4794645.1 YcxB family protein [Exiguobacterium alkaliphilum]
MIHFLLTKDDFFAVQKNFIENSDYHKRRARHTTIILMLLTVSWGFLLAILLLPQTLSVSLFLGLAIGSSLFLALLLFPLLKKAYGNIILWQLRHLLKLETKWPRDTTLYINEHGIERKSLHNNVTKRLQVAWEAIERVSEDETNHYLYVESRETIVVPKRHHTLSETEQTKINHLLQQNLNITL